MRKRIRDIHQFTVNHFLYGKSTVYDLTTVCKSEKPFTAVIPISYFYFLFLFPIFMSYFYFLFLFPIFISYFYFLFLFPIFISYFYFLFLFPIFISYFSALIRKLLLPINDVRRCSPLFHFSLQHWQTKYT